MVNIYLPIIVSRLSVCAGNEELGLESGHITDQQIKASSSWDKRHGTANARLNLAAARGKTGAWSSETLDQNQWLQVDFGRNVKVKKIATQGRQDADQWIKSYTLDYGVLLVDDYSIFMPYKVNDVVKVTRN